MARRTGRRMDGARPERYVCLPGHATTDAVTNGEAVDAAGNVLTFANDVYDASDSRRIGTDQGYCVRIVAGATWECNWTTFLPDGQISVEGPFSDTGDTVLSVTGGTGAYRTSRGSMAAEVPRPRANEVRLHLRPGRLSRATALTAELSATCELRRRTDSPCTTPAGMAQ